MRPAPLFGSLVVLLACSTLPATEVIVRIDADTISRKRAHELSVVVLDKDGDIRLEQTVRIAGDRPDVTLPTNVPIVPEGGDITRTLTVVAELHDQANVAFNKKTVTRSFVDHRLVSIDLFFSDLCIGIDCPEGQTCSDGTCVDIKAPPHGAGGPFATDVQPAYCEGPLCWEEPRPGGEGSKAACMWAPDAGLVIDNGLALELENGVWISEPIPPGIYPDSLACWSGGEAIATIGTSILERSASGWKARDLGGAALHAIWGLDANDVWAVASGGEIWRRKSHGAWTKVSSGVATDLLGIFGIAANDIYVVGTQSTLLHYDGVSFTPVPGPATADPQFTHVAGTSKSDLAVKAGTSVWTFDGKAWSEYAPFLGVVSLTGGPSGLLVAGGARGTAHFRSQIGAPWGGSPVAFPFDGPALPAIAVSGQSAIVGGDAGGLAHWNGTGWDSTAAWLTRAYPQGIANDPDQLSHAVVVAGGGLVLERVGEGLWRRRVVGDGAEVVFPSLNAVWMGHGISVAVGAAGAIAESPDGHVWNLVPSGSTLDLAAVDSAGSQVLAAGAGGALLERTTSGWSAFASPIPGDPSLTALRGSPDGSWLAGAADGSIWQLAAGGSWTQLGAVAAAVSDLAVDSSGGVWACADGIYHLQGGTFVDFAVSTSGPVHRILVDGATPAWLAAEGGVYQRQADGTYAGVGPPPTAMSFAADKRFFMAGNYGRILSGHAP
jgi:hypothetical protein